MISLFVVITLLLLWKFTNRNTNIELHAFDTNETLPLRGFLAICVLLCHLCPYFADGNLVFNDWGELGPTSVATFFLLAGYGLGISYKKKGKRYLEGFFQKRLSRLLLPFLVMTLVYQVYLAYIGKFEVIQLFAHPFPKHWFIYALLIWYCAYYIAFKWSKSLQQSLLAIWIFAFIYITVFAYMHISLYWVSILPLPMGITYAFYENEIVTLLSKNKQKVIGFALLMLMGGATYVLYSKIVNPLPGWGPISYTYLPFYFMILTYLYGGCKNRVTNFLGSISYEFYIVHGFIVMFLGEYGDFEIGTIGCLINISVGVMLSTLFGYGLSKIKIS